VSASFSTSAGVEDLEVDVDVSLVEDDGP